MIARNIEATEQLRSILNGKFSIEKSIQKVREGADPNTKDDMGNSLLHRVVRNMWGGRNHDIIEELVNIHKADINIQDANDLTPLQCLMVYFILMM